jgi:desulfoferrodoxin-like iron-binding protein
MQLYQCQFCWQMVEVWVQGAGSLSCYGSPLKPLGIGPVGPRGCQAQPKPPLDLREVVRGGKSRGEFPETQELRPENDRLADW